jgi:O-antigen/teichoic acid export membrane protein
MTFLNAAKDPRRMSVRLGLTATDQCVSSISNFAVGVVIARMTGVAGFGAYSLAYSVWLIVAALHRSLITDPMAIENDLHVPGAARNVRVGLASELGLGLAAAVLFAGGGLVLMAVGQHEFGICFLGLAPWLPFLLAQDYWRWIGFMETRPGKSLVNDIVFALVQVAAFLALYLGRSHSPVMAIDAWGISAVAAAAFGLWQFSIRPTLHEGAGRVRSRWHLSKWLVGVNAAASVQQQATVVLTGVFLGPAGIGGLKAATNLVSGPSFVLIQAGGSVGLPEASKALKDNGWKGLRRVHLMITAAGMASVGLIAVVVLCFGRQLLDLVYGPAFGKFAPIADILALAVFISTIPLGAILCLKATRQTRQLLPSCLGALTISVIAIVVLAPAFGVTGAAIATVAGNVTKTLWLMISHWTSSRQAAERIEREGAPALPSAHGGEEEFAEVLPGGLVVPGEELAVGAPVSDRPWTVDP